MLTFPFKLALCLLLLLNLTTQECNNGCLKCSADSTCQLCDFSKNLYLKEGQCEGIRIDNCAKYSLQGECMQCAKNHFLDTAQQKCISITSDQAIENCSIYLSSNTCLKCAPNYYLSGTICQNVTNKVENCVVYSGDGLCLECAENNILSIDNKKCHQISEIQNCQSYSSIKCLSCQADLYQQIDAKNFRIKSLLKENNLSKAQNAIELFLEKHQATENNCLFANSQNCKVLANFEECGSCMDGYYAQNGICVKNPEEAILHCWKYVKLNKCHTCDVGYHLTLDYLCQPNKYIQYCVQYDGAAYDETDCLKCEENFYLIQKNSCQRRQIVEIENCFELDLHQDTCEKCSDGYKLTTDNLACLPMIEFCQSYYNSYQDDTNLVCLQCQNGYYINDEGLCTSGSIENCNVYHRASNICKQCQEQFYLSKEGTCLAHNFIDKCDKYHHLLNNKCLECSFDSYLINTATQCVQTTIENCQKHIKKDYCGECKDGFMLENGRCTDMSTTYPNCLRGEYQVCRKCKDGYILEKGKCVQTYAVITQNCEQSNFKDHHTKHQAQCEICKAQTIPFNFKGSYMCIKNTMLESLQLTADITDCLTYRIDKDNNLKCTECSNGKKIGSDGTCTPLNCGQQTYSHLIESNDDKVKIVHKNLCKKGDGSFCNKYGVKQFLFPEGRDIEFGCTECKNGGLGFVSLDKTDSNFAYVDNTRFKWQANLECYSGSTLSPYIKSSQTNNCQYFYMIAESVVGCLKCKPGYRGNTVNYMIPNCAKHNPKTLLCEYCQRNYYLNGQKTECLKSKHVDSTNGVNLPYMNNCKSMAFDDEKCYECEPGYYLSDDGSTCTQFSGTIPNCDTYVHNATTNAPKCAVCDVTHILYNNGSDCYRNYTQCIKMASSTTCAECIDNYYPNVTASNVCSPITDSSCLLNEFNTNTCLIKYQNFRFYRDNVCQLVNITNCAEYNTDGTCKKCDNTHYLLENACYTVNTFKDDNAYTNIRNCYSYEVINSASSDLDLKYGCKQCKDNYHFIDINRARGTYYCIQDNYILYTGSSTPTQSLDLTKHDSGKCKLFDFSLNKCTACNTGYYMSNGICCTETNQNIHGQCATIPLSDCLRAEHINGLHGQNECLKCTATTHVLIDGQCCPVATSDYINANGQCSALPTQCKTIDPISKECSECNANYYLHPKWKFCCADKTVHKSDGTCVALTDTSFDNVPYISNLRNSTTECLHFDIKTSKCLKCKTGYSFNGKVCQSTSTLYQNCDSLNQITKHCDQCSDGFVNTEINICCNDDKEIDLVNATCITTLTHTVIPGCIMHIKNSADTAYECQQCEQYKTLKSGICCYDHQIVQSGACVDPAYDTTNCVISSSADQSCLLCRDTNSSNVKLHLSSGKCCPEKQYNNSGVCTALTDVNCLIPNSSNTAQCQQCDDGYYIDSSSNCAAVITHCIEYEANGTCTLCKPGYALDNTAANCTAITNNIYEGCAKLNSALPADDQCVVCRKGYNSYDSANRKYCCQLNYYFDTDLNKCRKIQDDNCATYDANKNCTTCFKSDIHCIKQTDNLDYIVDQYYLSNGKCVEKGTYYNGTSIENIKISNCLKLNSNACLECSSNYYLVNNRCEYIKDCNNYVDSNNNKYYKVNNNCCKEGMYWNVNQNGCVKLYDSNCLQSQDNIHCDKCASNFSSQKLVKEYTSINLANEVDTLTCPFTQINYGVYYCKENTIINNSNAIDITKVQVIDNCAEYNNNTKQCDVCKDGYYKRHENDICCQDNYVSIETEEGYKYCQQLSLIKQNCKNYDFENQTCLECNSSFQVSKGRCCSTGTYFNELTNTCDITFANCKIYDTYSKGCLQCNDGKYITNGICCVEGEVSNDGSTCVALTNDCLIQDDYNQCHKCIDNTKYLTFGHCCSLGNVYNYNTSGCVTVQTLDSTLTGCNKVDDNLNCIECADNTNVLVYGKCCASNQIWNYDACVVPSTNGSDNCLEYVQFTESQLAGMSAQASTDNIPCKKCNNTHTNINGKCILTAQVYDLENNFGLTAESQALLNINLNCLEWKEGICNKCVDGKVLVKDVSGSGNVSCTTASPSINNCHVFEDDSTKCYYCKDGYYVIPNNGTPICSTNVQDENCLLANSGCVVCKDGYYIDSDDNICKQNNFKYCQTPKSDMSACEICEEGYVLNSTGDSCIQASNMVGNCLTGKIINNNTFQCQACIQGYYLDESNSNTCTALTTTIDNCKLHKKTSGSQDVCQQCQDEYRLENSDQLCCHDTEVLNTSNQCQSVLQFNRNCKTFEIVDVNDIQNTSLTCTTCNTGYYLVQGTCCKEGTFYNGQQCVQTNLEGTQNCKEFQTNGLCKEINSQDRTQNCLSGYLTFNRCCPIQKYYNISQQKCVDIPNYLALDSQSCQQIDEDMNCIKCDNETTGRIYEGYCIGINNYLNLETMSLIAESTTASSFENCSIVKDQKCIACKTNYQLGNGTTSAEECCWDTTTAMIYNRQTQKCQTLADIDCTTYDFQNEICTTCANGGYFTGTQCCPVLQFSINNTCTAISSINEPWTKDCNKITNEDYDQKVCSECIGGSILQNGLCCQGSFNINGQCYESALLCKKLDANLNCTECQTGSILSGQEQKLCCGSNKALVFSNTKKEYECTTITPTISQCAIQSSNNQCIKCVADHYLDDNLCCPVGSYNNNGTCTSVLIQNCIEFETKESQVICSQCKDTFNLYQYRENNILKTMCCQDGAVPDYKHKTCVNITQYTTNCTEVDTYTDDFHLYNQSLQCITPGNTYYISNGVPCQNNTYWNGTSCTTIPVAYPNCAQVSDEECLLCSNTSTHYLIGGQCCQLTFYNNNGTCTDDSSSNCKQFYNECPSDDDLHINCNTFAVGQYCEVCADGYYLTYAGKCCLLQSYYDSNTNTCKTYASKSSDADYRGALLNCQKFDKDLNCLDCSQTLLSDDGSSCCNFASGFVNNLKSCSATANVPTGCKQYDGVNFTCKQCQDDYYLTDGFCCANDQYFDVNTYTCKAINTTTLQIDTQCMQYKVIGGCQKCQNGYLMNRKEQCIAIPNQCDDFDADLQMCFQCKTSYYLTQGKCCQEGQFNNNNTCVNISTKGLLNCEKYDNGVCIQCSNGYYEQSGYCCQEGYYHDSNSNSLYSCVQYPLDGVLKDCLQFGVDKHHCTKCKDNHVLINYDNYKSRCQKIATQTTITHINYKCIGYEMGSYSNTNGETMQCNKCDQTGITGYYKLTSTTPTYYEETVNNITKPANCDIIDLKNKFNESTLKCVRCVSTHYLNERSECILRTNTNCKGPVPYDKDICLQCNENYYLTFTKKCVVIPITYCQFYDPLTKLCQKCTNQIAGKNIQLHYEMDNGILKSKCVDVQPYDLAQQDKRIFLGYIDQCNNYDTNQIQNKFASNLEYYYDYFYSIHYCLNNQIPVSFVRMGIDQTSMPTGIGYYNVLNNSNLLNYDLDDYLTQINNNFAETPGKNIECINTLRDVFPYFTQDQFGTHLPSNCAMMMVNVSLPLSTTQARSSKPDLSELSAFCSACKDGYKPLRNSRVPLHVYDCQAIPHCATSTQGQNILNGCSACESGYAFGVVDGKVDYTQCIQTSDTYCLATLDGTKCKFCKQGFMLNYDGKCSNLVAPHCQDSQFSFTDEFNIKNFGFVNDYLDGNKGCINCDEGFVSIYQDKDRLLCASSQTLVENDFDTTSQVYDIQCKFYGLNDNKIVCKECNENYLITIDNKCIAIGEMTNCDIAIKTAECYSCKPTHVNVNKICVEKTIENCKSYFNSPNQLTLQCQICEDGFLLKQNSCEEGHVDNCAAYDDRLKCIKCKANHVLTFMNGLQRCLLIEETLHANCKHYNSQQFQENIVVCEQCISDQFVVEDLYDYQDYCINIPLIENCIQYDKSERLIDSSFKCQVCADGYRLIDNQCILVTDRDPNCEEFSKPDYYCQQCKLGYYLDQYGEKCLQQPIGVQGCAYYKDKYTCKYCKTGLYLQQNKCVEVPLSNVIEFCKFYQNAENCLECEDGKILENNKCLEPIAQCLTYYNVNECRTCPEGQGIQIVDGKRACVQVQKREFCAQQKNVDPFECIVCTNGYYLEGGICIQIQEPIIGCIQYDGALSCALCETGQVLAHDKKSCQTISFNDKCAQYEEINPFCIYCKPGYILKGDSCIQDSNNVIIKNCLGVDMNGDCNVCLPGYTMNEDMKCN